jgi:type I restriction enzyme S subunit
MLAELEPYPEYKDIDQPWVGKVPSHWQVERGKRLFVRMQRPATDGDQVVTCFRDGVVTLRKNRRLRGFTEAIKEIGYQGIRAGDLVIHAMDAFAGAIGVSDSDGKGSPVYQVCTPRQGVDAKYYAFLVREMSRSQWIMALAKGIRERSTDFRFETFGGQFLPLPPPAEQAGIVRFLGAVDRKVNRFIRAKRRLIEVLTEQKQAIITHAVTKGLNPSAPLKPSGIDWLGDVPEHWDVQRLKWLAHIKTGGRDTVHRKDDGAYPFFVRSQTVERIDTFCFDGEAVLTAGDGAGVAKVFHYVNEKFDYHQRVYKFSDFRRVRGKFFFHYFSVTLRFEAFRETAKSTVDSLRLPMLQDFPVPIPPLDEQDAIVAYVEEQTHGINKSISLIRREIDLIREYRTRLVADVVTGKVDVRAAAAALPDEPPPPGAEGAADDETPAEEDGPEADGDDPAEHTPEEVEA